MVAHIKSCTLVGIDAEIVDVECHVARGLPGYSVVGLAATSVKEGAVRIKSALKSVKHDLPLKSVTINLAPADLRKPGCALDLPIAIAVLLAEETAIRPATFDDLIVLGELGLDGSVRAVRGVLAAAMLARARGMRGVVVPDACTAEATVVDDIEVYGAQHLGEIIEALAARGSLRAPRTARRPRPPRLEHRHERGPWAGGRACRDRGRGRGRSQPAARRPARNGQDDARSADPDGAPTDDARGGARDHPGLLGARPRGWVDRGAAISRAAPHDLDSGAARWWRHAATRRDLARAPWRAVSRRDARVRTRRDRGVAPASRGADGHDRPGPRNAQASRLVLDGRRGQSMPVRLARFGCPRVHVQPRSDRALPAADVGAAARPDRSPGVRAAGLARRAAEAPSLARAPRRSARA